MGNLIHVSETDLSDFSKDAYGFRCRSYKEWWTKDELEAEYARLSAICDDNHAIEKEREDKALAAFETLVQDTIKHGAADRETAIRWLMDAEGCDYNYPQEIQYFLWGYGLSYEIQNDWENFIGN